MKRIFILAVIIVMVLVCLTQAHAALQNLGTDSLGNRLIYDSDFDITWYDYTKSADNWQNQMNWASGLSVIFGSNVYDDWRLPTALNQNGSGPCVDFNCTGSEMGHLYYTELGNSAGGPLSNTGDFQHLLAVYYWSGTEYSANPAGAWEFSAGNGHQAFTTKSYGGPYAIAVRPGLAVVPEPVSSILFVVGGASLGIRRFWNKNNRHISNGGTAL